MSDPTIPGDPTSGEPTFTDPVVEDPAPDAETSTVLMEATPDGVATVILNRPEKKNAFNQEVIGGLREAFEALQGADHVRVVFVRGAGGSFCAGADLEWMRDSVDWDEADNRDDAFQLARMLKALHDIPALTVALVDGAAFGGGVGLAAACDVTIATKAAKFAFSEVKLGLIPSAPVARAACSAPAACSTPTTPRRSVWSRKSSPTQRSSPLWLRASPAKPSAPRRRPCARPSAWSPPCAAATSTTA
jgi:Enoyl-CoA hydratase/isomerase